MIHELRSEVDRFLGRVGRIREALRHQQLQILIRLVMPVRRGDPVIPSDIVEALLTILLLQITPELKQLVRIGIEGRQMIRLMHTRKREISPHGAHVG
ncbi:hypothetical protein [Trinickia sp. Y13]|uniref:hypothetical protein n=1 Tax=Trinickia sp. Y13 TaxID=2917807 RepID=UPI0032163E87